jgi:cell division inhibitor SepF
MASSIFKKGMAYLGLVDDDYDDYDRYEQTADALSGGQRSQPAEPAVERTASPGSRVQVRRSEPVVTGPAAPMAPAVTRQPPSSSVRISAPEQVAASAKVSIVAPGRFADAQEIANLLMADQPVIVNMQSAERDLQRRMIDFCSGVTYALSGGMERVADEVFLLTPSNVKVTDEERQRLADSGLVTS